MNDNEPALRVAIVDDDAGACAAMARLLRAVGMSVDTYGSAEELVDAPQFSKYEGLVLDVRLPGMSGLELHRKLLEQKLRIPTVFVTAHESPMSGREALRQGCAGYFGKTESGSAVISALRSAAERYRERMSHGTG